MPTFRPRLLDSLQSYTFHTLRADVLAGITIGIIALPLAMAFAIASGVKPEAGIFTAIIAGFIVSALGGTRLCIAGPTGAFVVILYGIYIQYGLANLLLCTFMAGVMLIAMGILRLGALIRFIPLPVIAGFTNGIAVLILLSQVKEFLGLPIAQMPGEFFGIVRVLIVNIQTVNWPTLAIALVSLIVMFLWPSEWSRRIPSPMIVLVGSTVTTILLGDDSIATIGNRYGGVPQALPSLQFPDFDVEKLGRLIAPAATIALLGAIESLLCAVVADKQTRDKHDANQELIAQGLANVFCPLFGGIAATNAIARTSANIKNGALTPISGIVHALTLLIIVIALAPLAKHIPLAALSAILIWVAYNMGEWHEFKRLPQYTPLRNVVYVATFLCTVVFDLTLAVEIGLVLATLLLIRRLTETVQIARVLELNEDAGSGAIPLPNTAVAFQLRGAFFFGVVDKITAVLSEVPADTRTVILGMRQVIYLDSTALAALERVAEQMDERKGTLILCCLSSQPTSLIERMDVAKRFHSIRIVATAQEASALAQTVN